MKILGLLLLSLIGVVSVVTLNRLAPTWAVPEPGTLLLLGTGLVSLGVWGRKKFLNQK